MNLRWKDDKVRTCEQILARCSPLKIILKTKDEPLLLEDWILHHQAIAGLENLIIFDNESTSPAVRELYSKYDDCLVVSYDGFHNNIHDVAIFAELYDSLRRSSDAYIFLDTDERLVMLEDGHLFKDRTLSDFISNKLGGGVLPTTWVSNLFGTNNKFWLGEGDRLLLDGLKWGKPVISSEVQISGFTNHNSQLRQVPMQRHNNLFLLHLNRLSVEQRVRTNLNKLAKRKVIPSTGNVSDVMRLDVSAFPDQNVKLYINEIISLSTLDANYQPYVNKTPPGSFMISDQGKLVFSDDAGRKVLDTFLARPLDYQTSALENT